MEEWTGANVLRVGRTVEHRLMFTRYTNVATFGNDKRNMIVQCTANLL